MCFHSFSISYVRQQVGRMEVYVFVFLMKPGQTAQKGKSEIVDMNQAWVRQSAKQTMLSNDKLKKQAKQSWNWEQLRNITGKQEQNLSMCVSLGYLWHVLIVHRWVQSEVWRLRNISWFTSWVWDWVIRAVGMKFPDGNGIHNILDWVISLSINNVFNVQYSMVAMEYQALIQRTSD